MKLNSKSLFLFGSPILLQKNGEGIEKGKKTVSPCALFSFAEQLMKFAPFVRNIYWGLEKKKFNEFKENVKRLSNVKK